MYPQLNKTLSPEITNTQVSNSGEGWLTLLLGEEAQCRITYGDVEGCGFLNVPWFFFPLNLNILKLFLNYLVYTEHYCMRNTTLVFFLLTRIKTLRRKIRKMKYTQFSSGSVSFLALSPV